MRKFENVEYTKPYELLFLFVSTLLVFFLVLFLLNRIEYLGLIKVYVATIMAGVYFWILRKKFVVKVADFKLTSDKLEWNNRSIHFRDLEYYKIHWTKGAGVKFRLKNGKTIRVSSNDNFCNSEKFVNLCHKIDSKLLNYNNGKIIRKKSFFETKQGYYFAVTMTVLFVIGTIYKSFTDEKFNFGNFVLILVSLGIVWSGVKWKKK